MSEAAVFKTIYEVVGEGLPIAAAFFAEVAAARNEQWKVVEAFGAQGFRPSHNGRARSLFFKELPAGWRQIGRDGENIEAVPHKGSKVGKEAAKSFDAFPECANENHLSKRFGWTNDYGAISSVAGRSMIHFSTTSRIILPVERIFIQLPRQIGDGFVVPPGLMEVTEGVLMRAIADHNDAVAARKAA